MNHTSSELNFHELHRKQVLRKYTHLVIQRVVSMLVPWHCVFTPEQRPACEIFSDQKKITLTQSLPHPLFWTKWHMQCHQVQWQTHVTNSREFWLGGKHPWCIGEQQFHTPFLTVWYLYTRLLNYNTENKKKKSLLRSAFQKAKALYKNERHIINNANPLKSTVLIKATD